MTPRSRWKWLGYAGLACILATAWWIRQRAVRPQVNVLLVTLDTTRADHLGCYGSTAADTPALDRLAREGVLFERCYSPAPLTLPVHATLLTGLHPPEHGLRTNGRGALNSKIPSLPVVMQDRGYATAAFVSSFVLDSRFGLARGFDVYDDDLSTAEPAADQLHQQRDGRATIDAALDWLNKSHSKPYFCWVHLYDPHAPYLPHEAEFGDRFTDRPYDAELAYVDREIARLHEFVTTSGHAHQTVIVVVGDHGEGLGEHVELTHGYTLYNSTQHVPLLIWAPGRVTAGHRVPGAFPLVDLTATLLNLCGLPAAQFSSSRTAHRVLRGEPLADRPCYAATDDPYLQNGWSPLRSLCLGGWKYVRTSQPELYDLANDHGETRNLAEVHAKRLIDMESQLRALEADMQVGESSSVQLSQAEVRALRGLGYLGGGNAPSGGIPGETPPDVKEMLPFDVQTADALKLMEAGRWQEAAEILRLNVDQSRRHLSSQVYLGEALEQLGQHNEAVQLYQQVLSLKPDHVDALVHLGSALSSQGRDADAIRYFDEALQADFHSSPARFNLALSLARQNRLREAAAQLEKLLDSDPTFANAHTAMANVCLAMGDSSRALTEFRKEVELNPRAVEARINLAALTADSDIAGSERLLKEALAISPDDPNVLYNLAALHLMRNQPGAAIPHLERVLRIQPGHPRAAGELHRARELQTDQVNPR